MSHFTKKGALQHHEGLMVWSFFNFMNTTLFKTDFQFENLAELCTHRIQSENFFYANAEEKLAIFCFLKQQLEFLVVEKFVDADALREEQVDELFPIFGQQSLLKHLLVNLGKVVNNLVKQKLKNFIPSISCLIF